MKTNKCVIISLEGPIASEKSKYAHIIKEIFENLDKKVRIISKESTRIYIDMIKDCYDVIILDD